MRDPAFSERDYAILRAARKLQAAPVEDVAREAGLTPAYVRRRVRSLRQYAALHAARWGLFPGLEITEAYMRSNRAGFFYAGAILSVLETRKGYGKGIVALARELRATYPEMAGSVSTLRRRLTLMEADGVIHNRAAITVAPYGLDLLLEEEERAAGRVGWNPEIRPDMITVGGLYRHYRDSVALYRVDRIVHLQGLGPSWENRLAVVYSRGATWCRPLSDFRRRFVAVAQPDPMDVAEVTG